MICWRHPYRALGSLLLAIQPALFTLHAQYSDHHLLHADAKWDISYMDASQLCPWIYGHTWKIIGDTVINGQAYSRLGIAPMQAVNGPPFCAWPYVHEPTFLVTDHFLREDTTAGMVYYYHPAMAAEIVHYDWNMLPGDTLEGFFLDPGIDVLATVTGMDSVQLSNGTYRKRWQLDVLAFGTTEVIDTPEVVEGIGSSVGLLHFYPRYYGNGTHLWCYQRASTQFGSSIYCSSPNPLGTDDLNTQPAPGFHQAGNTLVIAWPGSSGPTYLSVISMDGRIVHETKVGGDASTSQIAIGHWSEGVYILHGTAGNGKTWSQRFMKH